MKRVIEDELLDEDLGTPEEVADSLRSLRRVNRCFGGDGTHAWLLERVADRMLSHPVRDGSSRVVHILEVASGRATVLQAAAKALLRRGAKPTLTLLDRSERHFPAAGDWDAALPAPEKLVGDALRIPLVDGSVDVVSCCLFLHHLDEHEAESFLREALRVARVAVVVNDLERTPVHYALARVHALVDGSRISRHDGPVSVRRAYTKAELERILRGVGCEFELRRRFLFRLGAILWK